MLPLTAYLEELHAKFLGDVSGEVASYIPELARVDADRFGICIVMVDGTVYEVGDTRVPFTIQSMSKPLTYAMASTSSVPTSSARWIGLEPTGDAFNAISLDPITGRATNAMVNAGAITAADLIHATHGDEAVTRLVEGYSKFAGRPLSIDSKVAESERITGHRNRAIAHLLRGAGSLGDDVEASLEVYFHQCSVEVDGHDLGVIAATLANGGRNPVDGSVAVTQPTVRHVLSVMSSCGMYDGAGRWMVSVGLPAKSGVSGGIFAVLPGQCGIGVFSPRLDQQGNSVRGVEVCQEFASTWSLHLVNSGRRLGNRQPTVRTLADGGSNRRRTDDALRRLAEMGDRVLAIRLRGEIQFSDAEFAVRHLVEARAAARNPASYVIVDLSRTDVVHGTLALLIAPFARELAAEGGSLVIVGLDDEPLETLYRQFAATVAPVHLSDTLNEAFEWCEDRLLER